MGPSRLLLLATFLCGLGVGTLLGFPDRRIAYALLALGVVLYLTGSFRARAGWGTSRSKRLHVSEPDRTLDADHTAADRTAA